MPENTTILGAAKVTGKTNDGLSVARAAELHPDASTPRSPRPAGAANPSSSPSAATPSRASRRTSTRATRSSAACSPRPTAALDSDPTLAFLPTQAWSGGVDFTRYFGDRDWLVEGNVLFSQRQRRPRRRSTRCRRTPSTTTSGRTPPTSASTRTRRRSPATAVSLRGGTSGKGRFRLTDHFHWYSPGLDLNDVGYLRQADLVANQVFVGWSESTPKGIFRDYSFQASREDHWDFGGLQTKASTGLDASGTFKNKWGAPRTSPSTRTSTPARCAAAPRCARTTTSRRRLRARTDTSRRGSFSLHGEHAWASSDDSRKTSLEFEANVRPPAGCRCSAEVGYEKLAGRPAVRRLGGVDRGPALGARPDRPGHLVRSRSGRT